MLFSSTAFIFIFLPSVLLLYYLLKGHRTVQNTILCLFSLIFYAWGEPKFVLVMMLSIIINWILGLLVDKSRSNKKKAYAIITADLVLNLGLIFVFKYLSFAINNINALLFANIKDPHIALPIGISFFTFQAISYVIDVYRGSGQAQKNILNVALYISFFPQLIAGPIVRYETISDQIYNRKENWNDFSDGVVRFIIGLSKKIILANNLALVADAAFDMSHSGVNWFGISMDFSSGMAWLGAIAYTLQIFFDFSGYSDMAIGLGRMFGFHFLENFNYPYISKSVTEFWRRWHISLGTWFRDYLYIPLGGSRCTKVRNYINLFIVWLCTGIWHGANWTFIVWGLMYCALLMIERASGVNRSNHSMPVNILRWIYTIFFVVVGWVIFRADTLPDAFAYLQSMFTGSLGIDSPTLFYLREYGLYILLAIICAIPVTPWIKNKVATVPNTSKNILNIAYTLYIVLIFVISISFIIKGSYNPFIYFNF